MLDITASCAEPANIMECYNKEAGNLQFSDFCHVSTTDPFNMKTSFQSLTMNESREKIKKGKYLVMLTIKQKYQEIFR